MPMRGLLYFIIHVASGNPVFLAVFLSFMIVPFLSLIFTIKSPIKKSVLWISGISLALCSLYYVLWPIIVYFAWFAPNAKFWEFWIENGNGPYLATIPWCLYATIAALLIRAAIHFYRKKNPS